jgi:hypothetical protein
VGQVVGAFVWREGAKDVGDGIPKLVLCSRGGLAQQGFYFGECQRRMGRLRQRAAAGGVSAQRFGLIVLVALASARGLALR